MSPGEYIPLSRPSTPPPPPILSCGTVWSSGAKMTAPTQTRTSQPAQDQPCTTPQPAPHLRQVPACNVPSVVCRRRLLQTSLETNFTSRLRWVHIQFHVQIKFLRKTQELSYIAKIQFNSAGVRQGRQ